MADHHDVVIIGGGIAGLSAAHHLVRAGVGDVHVYEASDRVGGKARSQTVAIGAGYPGEHGFRFFPHFYRHIVDTMRTTPVAGGGTALDRLVGSRDAGVAFDQRLLKIARPARPSDAPRFLQSLIDMLSIDGMEYDDVLRYAAVMLQFATSCHERREQEYDLRSWAEFARADTYSKRFHELVILASRNLSAMRAAESSAATIGAITLQMVFDFDWQPDRKMDPLLCGPTDETWLQPWYEHLRASGVTFHFDAALEAFDFDETTARLRAVRIDGRSVTAKHYVCAIPLDCIVPHLTDAMCTYDASLARLRELEPKARGHMVGVQYFLSTDAPIVRGHVHYPQTPFALTSVSQAQFWTPPPHERPGTPELRGIVSAIISDWNTRGTEGIAAHEYTDRDALLRETWRQMASCLPPGTLREADLTGMHLDTGVTLAPFRNPTPLLIHPKGQRALRPDAATRIPDFYLASDYVRTNTDLATMEGADEAARRAVRALLTNAGVVAARQPAVWEFGEGAVFDFAKRVDRLLFERKKRHPMEHSGIELAALAHEAKLPHPLGDAAEKMLGKLGDAVHAPAFDWSKPDGKVLERWVHRLSGG